jgi:hypothetical protein
MSSKSDGGNASGTDRSASADRTVGAAKSLARNTSSALDPETIKQHRRQRAVSKVAGPIWVTASVLVMRFYFRYRIRNVDQLREQYRRIRAQSDAPILVCANHLTLVDSFTIAWALGSGVYWLRHPDELPWNTPEATNFGRTWLARMLIFLAKCIPITRGGAREEVGQVLERVKHLLAGGETALLFPEAGRSRSGRVEESAAAWGVGRIVGAVPGCRVLCIYMRGEQQATWSDFPAKGDTMNVEISCIQPKSEAKGVRRSRDIAQQIVRELMRMEEGYFDAR